MQYGKTKLKVRRDGDGDFVRYDSGIFRISWGVAFPPAPAAHVLSARSATYISNGKQIDLYACPGGDFWLGWARRVEPAAAQ